MTQALDDLSRRCGAPEAVLILGASRDQGGQPLERADSRSGRRLALPQTSSKIAVEYDAALLFMPLNPTAEVLEARRGAKGERDPGDEKNLGSAQERGELLESRAAKELPRGRLPAPVGEPGARRANRGQTVDAGLAFDRRFDEPNALPRQSRAEPGGISAVAERGDEGDLQARLPEDPGETRHRVGDIATECEANLARFRWLQLEQRLAEGRDAPGIGPARLGAIKRGSHRARVHKGLPVWDRTLPASSTLKP